ncbi:TPA: acriflavine resistance protein B, partial [Candidatus Sumerlaeota bacterium]|nr:acriflavine resistance protein B [Candidatus Sumerlaeota bacterium]
MNICEPFIRRPVMTTLVMAAVLIFGYLAYTTLPVSDLPNVDQPMIQVSANLSGASPETMASAVALPLEKQFSTIAGLETMSSSNAQGNTRITLEFKLDRNVDAAAQDVQAMISKAARDLPQEMTAPPSYQKINPSLDPVLYLVLMSDTLPLSTVDEYAETMLAQRISMVDGIAQVSVYGSKKYAVRAQLDPNKMAAMQLGIDEVSSAVQAGNANMPTGTLWGTKQAYTVQAQGQIFDAAGYKNMIVSYKNGSPVRLGDLGTVSDDVENNKQVAWYGDSRAIILAVQRQPGANTVKVVDDVKALFPQFKRLLPGAVQLDVLFDASEGIRSSVADVKFTLMLTMMLVVLVIFLFLRKLSATIIPSLALPLSVIGTFAGMRLLNFSIDNLSLMALTLAVGFVVDDAIVMLENIVRHIEMGEKPFDAALKGSGEIGFTILSMTLSLVAVFIPVIFMGGIIGRMLNEFAITITIAILVSGTVSLTLTPMLCSRFLHPHREHEKHNVAYNALESFFQGLQTFYRVTLKATLHHRRLTMCVFLATLFFTYVLFTLVPKGLLSGDDIGRINISTEGAQGTSFDAMVAHQDELAKILAKRTDVGGFMNSVGAGGMGGATNTGRFFVRLKPRHEREDISRIVTSMFKEMNTIPGIRVFPQAAQSINIGGRSSKSQYQFTLSSPDKDELYKIAPVLEEKLRSVKGLIGVTSDLQMTNPQVSIDIDRDKAASVGVTVEQIQDALYTAYGSRQISTIYAPNNQYKVIMELLPEYQTDPSSLSLLYVRGKNGGLIPLNTLAKITRTVGPLTINHQGQLPGVTISFNIDPDKTSLGEAKTAIDATAAATLPGTVTGYFQGTAQAFAASFKGLGILLLLAVFVIYIVLGILYESFIHPITILSGLPSAGVGALLALLLLRMELGLYSFVGVILLIGIVKKNAI